MATIEATLKPSGQGKVILNGFDISKISNGITIENNVHIGNRVTISIPAPLVTVKAESDHVYFEHDGKRYRLMATIEG